MDEFHKHKLSGKNQTVKWTYGKTSFKYNSKSDKISEKEVKIGGAEMAVVLVVAKSWINMLGYCCLVGKSCLTLLRAHGL